MCRKSLAEILVAAALWLSGMCGLPACADDVRLSKSTVLHFADVREARRILAAEDKFVQSLSRFDLESRIGRLDSDKDAFRRFVAEQALPWEADKKEKLSRVVARLRNQWPDFPVSMPSEIMLICTTGKEEGGAAYCRGDNAIVLPASYVERAPELQLKKTLVHELFHILSRNNPNLKQRLYAVVGFKPCPTIAIPTSLRERKITNPDAPTLEYYVEIKVEGTETKAVPVLFSSADRYDPKKGGPFFRYLEFRLMAIEEENGRWTPVLREGEPLLIEPRENASFGAQIGNNTGYIIHPDEILADNFVHLVEGAKNLPTPRIVEQMRIEFSRSATDIHPQP